MRIPGVLMVFLFIVPILIDAYIALDVRQMWRKKGLWIYLATTALCYALLIVAISLPRRDAEADLSPIMWMLFTFLTIYFGKIIYAIFSFLGRCFKALTKIESKIYPARLAGLVFGLLFIGIMWAGSFYTRRHIMVEKFDFQSNNLPASFEDYQIVQISDLHVGTWGKDTTFLQTLVDTINGLNPDLVVFTGDIVNQKSNELKPFMNVLSRLHAKDGVYSILGNHDYGDYVDWPSPMEKERNLRALKEYQQEMGWKLLNNESLYIHNGTDSILLIGVENWGEPPFPKYGNLEKALSMTGYGENRNDSTFKLLLSHNPEHWNQEVSKKTNIDLTLSGHTHALQSMIKIGNWKWSPAKYKYEQWGGRFDRENTQGEPTTLYVNIGAGAVGMPARLLTAFDEVTLITLKR